MREYELYLVIDGDTEEDDVGALVERVSQLITAGHGGIAGEVVQIEPRGRRRLAYPINKKSDGQDYLLTLRIPPQALPEIERMLKLSEDVLRYLILRTGDD